MMTKLILYIYIPTSLILLLSCSNNEHQIKEEGNNYVLNDSSKATDIKAPPIEYEKTKLELLADSLYNSDMYLAAIPVFTKLIGMDSLNGEYYFKRAYSYNKIYKRPKVKVAIDDYLRAIKLNYRIASAYYNLGLSHCFVEDSTALFYFEKCLKVDPSHNKVLFDINECKSRLESAKEKKYKSGSKQTNEFI